MLKYKSLHIVNCTLSLSLLLAACSGSEPDGPANGQMAIHFSSSIADMSATRAGETGALTTDALKALGLDGGFGVFAYYTGTAAYNTVNSANQLMKTLEPNFMYNQQVWWNPYGGDSWNYTPLKYWPNDNQPADDEGAQGSVAQSRVSFFAYAPWVDHTAASLGTDGITAISANTTVGDPTVTYVLNPLPEKQVDLLWGTRGKDTYQEADGTPNTDDVAVNTDLTKQTTTESVDFRFRHALTCLDVYVQRVYDELTPTGKAPTAESTKIFVSRLQLTYPADQMVKQGTLNLARGIWTKGSAFAAGTIDITDSYISPAIVGTTAANSALAAVQAAELDRYASKSGVTKNMQRLTELAYATMLIPADGNSGLTLTPTLTYSFVTDDPALELSLPNSSATSHYARILHTVQGNPVNIGTEYDDGGVKKYRLEAGKRYILVCYIGVESVQFQVISIEDWDFPMRYTTSLTGFDTKQIEKSVKEQ